MVGASDGVGGGSAWRYGDTGPAADSDASASPYVAVGSRGGEGDALSVVDAGVTANDGIAGMNTDCHGVAQCGETFLLAITCAGAVGGVGSYIVGGVGRKACDAAGERACANAIGGVAAAYRRVL